MVQAHLREGGAALLTTHGAYAAPPVRTRMLRRWSAPHDAAQAAPLGTARALLARDLRLLWRRRGDALQPALFALLVVVLFALALGGEAQDRWRAWPRAVLWLAVLLAGLLALDTLFRGDAEDGSLEQWMLAPVPLAWLVLVRTFMHWASTALPLLIATPLLGRTAASAARSSCRCCWPRWRWARRC